jgi:threonyl-tRNA synthetase
MLVVGEKEMAENVVSVRKQGHGDLGTKSIEEFAELVKTEIDNSINKQ